MTFTSGGLDINEQASYIKLNKALAAELEDEGYHISTWSGAIKIYDRPFLTRDKNLHDPIGKIDQKAKLLFSIHAQKDGFLVANQTGTSDAKPTTLIPYNVPDMFERILNILGSNSAR